MNKRPYTALKSLAAAALVIIVCGSAAAAPRPPAPSPIQENSNTVRVRVVDESNGEGIEGASVLVRSVSVTNQTGQELYGPTVTDAFGWATLAVDGNGKFRVEISKPGYKYKTGQGDGDGGAGGRLIDFGPAQRQRRMLVPLIKGTAEGRFKITVRVADGADNAPLAGARVVVTNPAVAREVYELTTGADGTASADLMAFDGTYHVEVSKDGYKAGRSTFESAGGHRQPDIKLPVALEKESKEYAVRLVVKVLSAEGNQPVVDAKVEVWSKDEYSTLPAFSGRTDGAGQAAVSVAESGSYRVKVTHSNFRGKTQPVQVRKYSDAREVPLNFSLARGSGEDEEEGEEGAKTVKVFIEVKDAETRENVRGAEVRLKLKDGSLHATENTLDGGMLTFEVPSARAREGMTAEVSQSWVRDGKKVVEYGPNASDVPRPPRGGGPIGLNVYLTKSAEAKKSDEEEKEKEKKEEKKEEEAKLRKEFADELARLRAEVVGFDGEKKQLSLKSLSVTNHGLTIQTEARQALQHLANLKAGADKVKNVAEGCRLAEQVKAQLAAAVAEVEREEEGVRKQLDYGERLASECKDEFGAETAKSNYRAARDSLLKVSRALEDAREKNAALGQAQRRGGAGDASMQKELVEGIESNLRVAQREDDALWKTYAEGQALSAKLSGAAPSLRARVLARVAEWRKTPLPEDLAREVDGLEALAAVVSVNPGDYDFRRGPALADEFLPHIKQVQAEAAGIVAASEGACGDESSFKADEEVSRMERVWIGMGVEVGAAEGWAQKADECLEKLKESDSKKENEEEKKKDDEEEAPESVEEGPESAEEEPETEAEKGKVSPAEAAPEDEAAGQGSGTQPASAPGGGAGEAFDLSGVWTVVIQTTGNKPSAASQSSDSLTRLYGRQMDAILKDATNTYRWQFSNLGGGRWRVVATLLSSTNEGMKTGESWESVLRAVVEDGGRLTLMNDSGPSAPITGTYNGSAFSLSLNQDGVRTQYTGTRQ